MFVTTANTLNILPPLLDRMEVIRLAGYTEDEKISIANKYLLPKQIKDNGVKEKEMKLDDDIIKEVIRGYTKESGVRNLEREISKLARKVVKKIVAGEEKEVGINNKNLSDFLGVPKFKFGELESENRVGIVTGLAWTEYGGEILKIETVTMPGKGRMQITGKLGDVMQESVKALTDSCITSPNLPVICILPFPGIVTVSIFKISPPYSVQASPVTIPTLFSDSNSPNLNLGTPKKSDKFLLFIPTSFSSPATIFLTTFLASLEISLSRFLTPDSFVYPLMTSFIISSSSFISFSLTPLSLICFGNKYLFAMLIFSSSV